MYELESPLHDGNQNSTPEYTLSMIEKATTSATEFATVFNLFLSRDEGGEHVEVIKTANNFAQSVAEVLTNTKGLSRIAPDDAAIDGLMRSGALPGAVALRFFTALQSYRLQGVAPAQRKEIVIRNNMETKNALQKLSTTVESLVPKHTSALSKANGDIGDLVESEMQGAARAIEQATERLQALMSRPKDSSRSALDMQVHDAILEAAMAITNAIARLIKAATDSQQEIVAQGRGSSTSQAFYKRNNRWTEGLISAAKAVARATMFLIETADGVISGTKSLEQLIVASNEVASATAQLVQASRVKAELMSKTQEKLELAAKAVTEACKALVRQVKAIAAKQAKESDETDYDRMAAHEFKIREMEVQVSIVTLEKELAEARRRLGTMRRSTCELLLSGRAVGLLTSSLFRRSCRGWRGVARRDWRIGGLLRDVFESINGSSSSSSFRILFSSAAPSPTLFTARLLTSLRRLPLPLPNHRLLRPHHLPLRRSTDSPPNRLPLLPLARSCSPFPIRTERIDNTLQLAIEAHPPTEGLQTAFVGQDALTAVRSFSVKSGKKGRENAPEHHCYEVGFVDHLLPPSVLSVGRGVLHHRREELLRAERESTTLVTRSRNEQKGERTHP